MPKQYRDEKTGFIVTHNADEWQVGYQPPAPAPAPEPPSPYASDIGQGFRGSAALTASDASDFQTWLNNKATLTQLLNREAGNEPDAPIGLGNK